MLSSVEIFFFFIRLIKKNIMVLDFMMFFFQKRFLFFDDGECFEYLVDQEGFYTFFYNDSGLRKSNGILVDEEEEEELFFSKDSYSLCSVDSVIYNFQGVGEKFVGTKVSSGKIFNKVIFFVFLKRISLCFEGGFKFFQDLFLYFDIDQEVMFFRVIFKIQIFNIIIFFMCFVFSDEDSLFSRQILMEGEFFFKKCFSENVVDIDYLQENFMINFF